MKFFSVVSILLCSFFFVFVQSGPSFEILLSDANIPFSFWEDGKPYGYDALFLDAVKTTNPDWANFTLSDSDNWAQALDSVKNGTTDCFVGGVRITSDLDQVAMFSQPYYFTGHRILILTPPAQGQVSLSTLPDTLKQNTILQLIIGVFILGVAVLSIIVFCFRRVHNDLVGEMEIEDNVAKGISSAMWLVCLSAMCDGSLKGNRLRMVIIPWMVVNVVLIAVFSGTIASTLTYQQLSVTSINGPEDLKNLDVAVAPGLSPEVIKDIERYGGSTISAKSEDEAYQMVLDKKVNAMVHDAVYLEYHAANDPFGRFSVVGKVFNPFNYGIICNNNFTQMRGLNTAILKTVENDEIMSEIERKIFGSTGGSETLDDAPAIESTPTGQFMIFALVLFSFLVVFACCAHFVEKLPFIRRWRAKRISQQEMSIAMDDLSSGQGMTVFKTATASEVEQSNGNEQQPEQAVEIPGMTDNDLDKSSRPDSQKVFVNHRSSSIHVNLGIGAQSAL